MKKILVLKAKSIESTKREKKVFAFLKDYFSGKVQISSGGLSDVILEIKPGKIKATFGGLKGEKMENFDLVWLRTTGKKYEPFAIALAGCLDFLGIDYFDSSLGKRAIGGSKLGGLVRLATGNLPIPETFFCWSKNLKRNLDDVSQKLGFPLVVKLTDRHWGKGVFILNNEENLQSVAQKIKLNKQIFLQRFYPHRAYYRLLVLDYQVATWEKIVQGNGQFPKPIGGLLAKEFLPVEKAPQEMKDLAIKAAQRLSFEMAGVDIFQDEKTGQYLVAEVNRAPAFAVDYSGNPELLAVAKFLEKRLK